MKAQQYSVLSRLTECAKLPTDCVEFCSALKQNGNHEQKCMLAKLRIINYEKNSSKNKSNKTLHKFLMKSMHVLLHDNQ